MVRDSVSNLLLASSLYVATAAAHAQSPAASGLVDNLRTPPVVAIHTGAPGHTGYGVWAAGNDYKVSFDDGLRFVPRLGRTYPDRQEWRWRTLSATAGGEELVQHAPRLRYDATRASYGLGRIVERYHVRAEGVEQTFVLNERPAAGDLVIRGEIATAMATARRGAAHEPLVFADDDGRELLVYGRATAIDANGHTRAMTTAYDDGVITLRLDGDWIASAAFPLVVDPLLGAGPWLTNAEPIGEVDVVRASEGTIHAVWIAYSVYYGSGDGDVYLRRLGDNGSLGPIAFQDLSTFVSSKRPSCAYVAGADRVVLAFDDYSVFTGQVRRLRYYAHSRTDPTTGTFGTSVPGVPPNAWNADVGGTVSDLSGTKAIIVWQQENSIGTFAESPQSAVYGTLLDPVNGTASPPRLLNSSQFGFDRENPSVTQVSSGVFDNRWTVVWQSVDRLNPFGTWNVAGIQYYPNNTLSPGYFHFWSSSSHEMDPRVAGTGDRLLVACTARSIGPVPGIPTDTTGHQLRVKRVDWPATLTTPFGQSIRTLATQSTPSIEMGGLAQDRITDSHWGISWRNTSSDVVSFGTVGHRGELLQQEVVIGPGSASTVAPGAVSFNGDSGQFVIAYGVNLAGSTNSYAVIDRFEFPLAFPWYGNGTSCSPATIEWVGPQRIGSEFEKVRVAGAAVDSIHLMALSYEAAAVPLVGIPAFASGCWLNVSTIGTDLIGLFPVQVGANVDFQLPLPEFLPSDILRLQDFHTIGGGNLEFLSTERINVPIVK